MKNVTVGALIAAFFAGPAAGSELPVRDFARLPQFTQVKISPGGEYLAVAVPEESSTGLAVIRLKDMTMAGAARGGRDTHVYQLWWANRERVVVSLATGYGTLEEPVRRGEIMAMDADGKNNDYLYGYRGGRDGPGRKGTREHGFANVVATLPGDPRHILIAVSHFFDLARGEATATAYRLDVRSGETRAVARAPVPGPVEFLADATGEVRYAVATSGGIRGARTFVRDPAKDQWREFATGKSERTVDPEQLSADARAAYVLARDGTDTSCLVAEDLASGTVKHLACHPIADAERTFFSADRSTPLAVVFEPGPPEVKWLETDHPDGKLLRSLAASFPGQALRQVSWSQDGSRVVFQVYSDRNPGEYFLFDRATGQARYLLAQREWIDKARMAEVRPISFKARDGATVHGYLTVPPGREVKRLPMVVMPHGGPFGIRDRWEWDADAQVVASRGYAVLQVNFRGSAGYGFKYAEVARRGWGRVMIDDILDATRAMVKAGVADGSRLCIYGGSYGGYAALMSAVREPDLYRCVVGYAGVYDLEELREDTDIERSKYGREFLDLHLGGDDAMLREQSPVHRLQDLRAPVFIVHGGKDQRAPFNQATLLREALEARKHSHEWLAKPTEGHGFYDEDNREEFFVKLLDFLDRHIGAKRLAPPPAD